MPKIIELSELDHSADARRFRQAICNGDGEKMGTDRFTASGDGKVPAPVRPTLSAEDFTATGAGKNDNI